MSLNKFDQTPLDLPQNQVPLKTTEPSFTAPPAPMNSQVPGDLRPTILEARKHPHAEAIVKEVNEYFLKHWPFKTGRHRTRFVEEGYAWFVCLCCPLSLDERMHWGCRLLTLCFLIDDLMDKRSIEEGVIHNSKVIECARGNRQPDRSLPAEWMMYDLFGNMRAVDRQLADELLQPTIDFLIAQADANRMKPMSLKEYFKYRDADLGKGLISGIMRFCAGIYMTRDELDLVKAVEKNSMKHIAFVNDVCSFEKEVLAAKDNFELGSMCSSVPIMKDICDVNEEETKRVMWQMARAWEVKHFELKDKVLRKKSSPAVKLYFQGLEFQKAGNELWSLLTPRYNRVGSITFTEGR